MMRSLEQWQHFLEGAKHLVEIWTDHKNLEYFQTAQNLNRQQAWWSLYLLCFNYLLHHRPGTSMGESDTLSRCADLGPSRRDNQGIALHNLSVFRIHAL